MLNNIKVIFIHGVNNQTTNYSTVLYQKMLSSCRKKLIKRKLKPATIEEILDKSVQHEVLWADITTDLTNRYLQLHYDQKSNFFWDVLKKPIDPLAIQIMQYIKDKGDKASGRMNILKKVHTDMENIFGWKDLGEDPAPHEGHNAIVVGHSLGSVIAYDYLMGFRENYCIKRLKKPVTVRSFITTGSPIPLFITAMGHPDDDISLPSHVKKWINIFSPRDGIARRMQPFFRNIPIHEYEVSTGFFPIQSHLGYWSNDHTASILADEVLSALDIK